MKLEALTVKQLRLLREKIETKISEKIQAEKEKLRERFAEMARESGTSLDEIIGRKGKRRPPGKRMRDPHTGVEWGGRGRMPRNFDKSRAVAVQ